MGGTSVLNKSDIKGTVASVAPRR